jgi:uncharacterized delta-60 repeat protein
MPIISSLSHGISKSRFTFPNAGGQFDPSFNVGSGPSVATGINMFIQSDGKIIVGGQFTSWNGTSVNRIIRLNPDGSNDTSFISNIGTGADGSVYSIATQSDGKIIVGGVFRNWNGQSANSIIRLNANGTRDFTFSTNIGTGPSGGTGSYFGLTSQYVRTLVVQSDNKILVGGDFDNWSGTKVGYIVRLNSDGSRETSFTANNSPGANQPIIKISLLSDSTIVMIGSFTNFQNTAYYIAKLNSSGTINTTFFNNIGSAFNNIPYDMAINASDEIIVLGPFTLFNGTTSNTLAKIGSTGILNTTFSTNVGTGIQDNPEFIAFQPSTNKIIIGGYTRAYNGTTVNHLFRINNSGILDNEFTINLGNNINAGLPPSGAKNAIIQSNGRLIVGTELPSGSKIRRFGGM